VIYVDEKEKSENRSMFDKVMSIDEFKMSSIVIALFVFIIAIMVSFFVLGTIPAAFVDIIQWLIGAIVGVNGINSVTSAINNRNSNNNNTTNSTNNTNTTNGSGSLKGKV
jgi:uncharacterized membrane protein HdeD (DUF308 family)